MDDNFEYVSNVSFCCISGEKIQIHVLSQILIQDTVLKMCLDTRYIFHILYTYLDSYISNTTQHRIAPVISWEAPVTERCWCPWCKM